MGGRLDAVNAVEPTASLITNISLDHCDWLGSDVAAIAKEKAGVMRTGKPVVFAAPDMPPAIIETAAEKQANLLAAARDYHWSLQSGQWSWSGSKHALQGLARPGLAGDIQIQNAAGVLMLLEATGFAALLDTDLINAALLNTSVPGRAQLVADRFILDVAHNPGAAAALANTVAGLAENGGVVTILGMLDDKDVPGVVEPLNELTEHWITVTADSPRALGANEVARQVANATDRPCWIAESMHAAIERAMLLAGTDGPILITGSFYTVGTALVILAAPGHEYG